MLNCELGTGNDAILLCLKSWATSDEIEQYLYYGQQYFNFPEFVDAEDCVADTYLPGYEDENDDYDEDIKPGPKPKPDTDDDNDDFASALLLPLFFGLVQLVLAYNSQLHIKNGIR